jgi:hypothetical protein
MIFSNPPDLPGRQIVVEDHNIRLLLHGKLRNFDRFSGPDISPGIHPAAFLHDGADDAGAGGLGERCQLTQRIARIGGGFGQDHADQDRPLLPDRQFRTFQLRQ